MFWDSRVSGTAETGFATPAEAQLPQGLENVVAAQAMFPVTSQDEMRGAAGDLDVFSRPNEMVLRKSRFFSYISPSRSQTGVWERDGCHH